MANPLFNPSDFPKGQIPMANSPGSSTVSSIGTDNVFGAFGAVLGYIGAEAATIVSFERLLWPQRFYSQFSLQSLPKLAVMLPMGGPLHKAALKTLDVAFGHGLFRGAGQGHMLGTPFFRSLNWTYTMHGNGQYECHQEPLRNCLWARALSCLDVPALTSGSDPNIEKGPMMRARVIVSHLTLSKPSPRDKSKLPFVCELVGQPSLRVILAIIAGELSGILVSVGVAVALHTCWAIFWLAPLSLRLLSAMFALKREPLISLSSEAANDPPCDFEIHCPQSEGNFMLITGPPALVLQFVRHYGHPIRNRFREIVQLVSVISFGSLFPLGLLFSVVWMPLRVQYVWLSYQIYVVLAMHIVRFSQSAGAVSTEAKIAEHFGGAETGDSPEEKAILFGHDRHGNGTIKASLVVTYHNRNKEGKDCLSRLLQRHRPGSTGTTIPIPQVNRSATQTEP